LPPDGVTDIASRALGSSHYASLLRLEICERNLKYHCKYAFPAQLSYGSSPVVVYQPTAEGHGNFLPVSYKRILEDPSWSKRLRKVHTSSRTSLPRSDRRWCELDSCNSSDALLMNIFCYPELLAESQICSLLGMESDELPEFGFKARVPLDGGKFDRTEVDMTIGDLLVEAKLTESDFQRCSKETVETYRDFREVFDHRHLPQTHSDFLGYQLIRNVLAAHALEKSFCVLCDARRPDLIEQWYAVMRCVRMYELRTRCKVLTWQELAEVLPGNLRSFLDEKYGIRPGAVTPYQFEHLRD
jgi:Restriction Endonuclease associating with ARP